MKHPHIIAVFGSSQPQPGSAAYEDARHIGTAIARQGWTVLNGGYRGVMEAASLGAKEAGGATIGVTTDFFAGRGIQPNRYVDTEIRVPTYADRLLKLAEMGDGYVVLPGGSGTLTEFFFVWELVRNGSLTERPIVLYGGIWNRIIDALAAELAGEAAFRRGLHQVSHADSPEEAASYLAKALNSPDA